jgi:hypothetical protein
LCASLRTFIYDALPVERASFFHHNTRGDYITGDHTRRKQNHALCRIHISFDSSADDDNPGGDINNCLAGLTDKHLPLGFNRSGKLPVNSEKTVDLEFTSELRTFPDDTINYMIFLLFSNIL